VPRTGSAFSGRMRARPREECNVRITALELRRALPVDDTLDAYVELLERYRPADIIVDPAIPGSLCARLQAGRG
jgi:hypothetical protein